MRSISALPQEILLWSDTCCGVVATIGTFGTYIHSFSIVLYSFYVNTVSDKWIYMKYQCCVKCPSPLPSNMYKWICSLFSVNT